MEFDEVEINPYPWAKYGTILFVGIIAATVLHGLKNQRGR